MSRANLQNGTAPRGPGDDDGELSSHLQHMQLSPPPWDPFTDETLPPSEICPVCKSSRYLNPRMRFLVNPECYHKMCESCVDRIFSQGPAPCPVAGCGRTLRKARFRKQTFGDIKVEREVDIRRRVSSIFNRREEEFSTLLGYNDYLEDVETLTFNLIEGIDIPATEAKLASYAAQNATTIARNTALSDQEHSSASARQAAEKEFAKVRREAARREEDDERKEKDDAKREVLDSLAHGQGDPEKLVAEAQKVILKKSTARRTAAEKARQQQQSKDLLQPQLNDPFTPAATDVNGSSFFIKGLKPIEIVEPEKPYDPFGGMAQTRDYYILQEYYEHPWLEKARSDPQITAGGYDVKEYYTRTMTEAFAGLGCFIAEEVAEREREKEKMSGRAVVAVGEERE